MSNEQITLRFSKTEYERLLKLVYLGGWLVNSIRVKDRNTNYEKLQSKVFSYAGSAGLAKYADHDTETGAWRPSGEIEEDEEIRKFIDEYDEVTFWEGLCWNLANRDYARQPSAESDNEQFARVCRLKDAYGDEFERSALDNLLLVKNPFLKKLTVAYSALFHTADKALNRTPRATPEPQPDENDPV